MQECPSAVILVSSEAVPGSAGLLRWVKPPDGLSSAIVCLSVVLSEAHDVMYFSIKVLFPVESLLCRRYVCGCVM
jgi:hypothetical protein